MKTTKAILAALVMLVGVGACGGEPLPQGAVFCGEGLPTCAHYYCCAGTECPAFKDGTTGICRSVQDNFSE